MVLDSAVQLYKPFMPKGLGERIENILSSGQIANGPSVGIFEDLFRKTFEGLSPVIIHPFARARMLLDGPMLGSLEKANQAYAGLDEKLAASRDQISGLRARLNSWHRQLSQLHTRRETVSRDLAVADADEELVDVADGEDVEHLRIDLARVGLARDDLQGVAAQLERSGAPKRSQESGFLIHQALRRFTGHQRGHRLADRDVVAIYFISGRIRVTAGTAARLVGGKLQGGLRTWQCAHHLAPDVQVRGKFPRSIAQAVCSTSRRH